MPGTFKALKSRLKSLGLPSARRRASARMSSFGLGASGGNAPLSRYTSFPTPADSIGGTGTDTMRAANPGGSR